MSLVQGLGFDALGYRAQHTDFPHQPTTDQFFVPEQVEAYRSVGFLNMSRAIEELTLDGAALDTTSGTIHIDRVISSYRSRPKPPPEPIEELPA